MPTSVIDVIENFNVETPEVQPWENQYNTGHFHAYFVWEMTKEYFESLQTFI